MATEKVQTAFRLAAAYNTTVTQIPNYAFDPASYSDRFLCPCCQLEIQDGERVSEEYYAGGAIGSHLECVTLKNRRNTSFAVAGGWAANALGLSASELDAICAEKNIV